MLPFAVMQREKDGHMLETPKDTFTDKVKKMSYDTMDNQQIRLSDRKLALAWLAGIIDADGCVHFMTRTRRGYISHTPAIDVATINPATAEIVNLVTSEFGSMCWFMKPSSKLQAVRVSGIGRCIRLLEEIIPYMVTKQKEAELMLEWCKSRNGKKKVLRFIKGKRINSGYTEDENSLIAKVKKLKSDRNLRDYTPSPCWLLQGEDIVRSVGKPSE